jgi:hypothetical protein
MNSTRQAEWVSHQGSNCSSLDWSGIQALFAGAKSEVLILLDTCAAASSAATSQFGIMETIAACGFESRAAPPGEFSFTNALIEIMQDWINKPSFSVSILHTEILFQLKQKENKRGREGTKLEWCSSPIYLRYTQDTRSPGIELYCRTSTIVPEASLVKVPRPTTYTHATEANPEDTNRKTSPFYSLSPDKRYRVPRVLISISLEEDQPQLDSENCTRWFANMPFLAADVEVFPSCSTLMIMSIPLPVWNMFPDHPACSFIGYVTAPKLKNMSLKREVPDVEVAQTSQETTAGSSHDEDGAKAAVSQWKSETSLQPDLTCLKSETHATTTAYSPPKSEYSTPRTKFYFDWASSSTPLRVADIEVPTLKELEEMRFTEQKNIEVEEWRSTGRSSDLGDDSSFFTIDPSSFSLRPESTGKNDILPVDDAASTRNNKICEDETYYDIPKAAVQLNEADLGLIVRRQWTAAPTIAPMTFTQYQPATANDAIQLYRNNADLYSLASRRASWGTQRGSETALAGIEPNTASGNFLKRFFFKKSEGLQKSRRSTLFDTGLSLLRSFVPKNSRLESKMKVTRSPSHQDSESLLPRPKWIAKKRKPKLPLIQTSLTITSGPSAAMGKPRPDIADQEEHADEDLNSDDENEEMDQLDPRYFTLEDPELIVPNYGGFKAQVHRLNPAMDLRHNWLVSKIAHQQEIRYKKLLEIRVKHSQAVLGRSCSAGEHCVALREMPTSVDIKGNLRDSERFPSALPLVTDFSDDLNPGKSAFTDDTFPKGIPMPPTRNLPAEFECQLCFKVKKIRRPSEWTRHVYEDLQPFTCSYPKCKEPNSFKRKADWIRHENERHRHLEWWICNVDDCRYPCYRKDNFIQHLVREHKLPEPKQKTKAVSTKIHVAEPTLIAVEQCHHETLQKAEDEPCKFCGKWFDTWKKLTNHLAQHMEHIALPILRLVEQKAVNANTIISPIEQIISPVTPIGKQKLERSLSPSLMDFSPYIPMNQPIITRGSETPSYFQTVGPSVQVPNSQGVIYGRIFPSSFGVEEQPRRYDLAGSAGMDHVNQTVTTFGTTDSSSAGFAQSQVEQVQEPGKKAE